MPDEDASGALTDHYGNGSQSPIPERHPPAAPSSDSRLRGMPRTDRGRRPAAPPVVPVAFGSLCREGGISAQSISNLDSQRAGVRLPVRDDAERRGRAHTNPEICRESARSPSGVMKGRAGSEVPAPQSV